MSTSGIVPRSPLASASWEPRFVVEHYDLEALRHAVELWRSCSAPEMRFPDDAVIRRVARSPTCLQIAHPKVSANAWTALEPPIVAAAVPTLVGGWLETATYPPTPWFDGGEARGYCVYWAHFGNEERLDARSLVVIPKWFEIHK